MGTTFPLLLEFAGIRTPKALEILKTGVAKINREYQDIQKIMGNALKQSDLGSFCQSLSDMAGNQELRLASLSAPLQDCKEAWETLKDLAGDIVLDRLDFCIYISLGILGFAPAPDLKFLLPGIHTSSDIRTIEIFKGSAAMISAKALVVSPFLAAYLLTFAPFAEQVSASQIESLAVFQDPINPDFKGRCYSIRQNPPGNSRLEEIVVMETNLDDMTPQTIADITRKLLAEGALDVLVMPATMKKGRQGFVLQVLARTGDTDRFGRMLLTQTSTFGVRFSKMERMVLERVIESVKTPFGIVRVKKGFIDGECIKQHPEFDDVVELSKETGLPVLELYGKIAAFIQNTGTGQ